MQLQMLTSFFGRDKLVRILLVDAYNMYYVPKKLRGVPLLSFNNGHGKEASKQSPSVLTLELGKSKLVNYNAIKGVNVDICARAYFHAPSIVSSSV